MPRPTCKRGAGSFRNHASSPLIHTSSTADVTAVALFSPDPTTFSNQVNRVGLKKAAKSVKPLARFDAAEPGIETGPTGAEHDPGRLGPIDVPPHVASPAVHPGGPDPPFG
jgi:hypothetical protein